MPAGKFIDRIDADFLKALESNARRKEFASGQTIFATGDEPGGIFGIDKGAVYFSAPAANMEETIAAIGYPGLWFGLAPVITGGTRDITAVARSQATVLLCVPLNEVRQLLALQPAWWQSVAVMMMHNFQSAACVATDLLLRDHTARLCATLLRLAGFRPQFAEAAPELRIPVTHEELAAMSNLSRSYVSNLLRTMEVAGSVELNYREIRILKPAALWQKTVSGGAMFQSLDWTSADHPQPTLTLKHDR